MIKMTEEEAIKHIEDFYGAPIPDDWDIEQDYMVGFTLRHLIDIIIESHK